MKYWSAPKIEDSEDRYFREDGRLLLISEIFKQDLNPQFIYDNQKLPDALRKTIDNISSLCDNMKKETKALEALQKMEKS